MNRLKVARICRPAPLFFWLSLTSVYAASHHPQDFLKSIAGSDNEGAQIVQHYCANCHATKPIIQLGAPRMGDLQDWEPRIKLGIESLFKQTDEGLNAMPARGGCFECTDKQLMLAIMFMLPEKLRKSASTTHLDH